MRRARRRVEPVPPGTGKWRAWTRHEDLIANRFVRDLLRGKYPSVRAAAETCMPELARQHGEHPNWYWPVPVRSLGGVKQRIGVLARARNEVWPYAEWRPEEDAVIAPFAEALAKGVYRRPSDATRVCMLEMGVHRRLHPELSWLGRRSFRGITARMGKLARRSGWNPPDPKWSRSESALIERYARGLAAGRYRSMQSIAPHVQQEIGRLNARRQEAGETTVSRSLESVRVKLLKRSRILGRRAARLVDFAPQELRIIDAYAVDFRKGRFPSVQAAARACHEGLAHRRERYPRARWARVSRSFLGIASKLLDLVHEHGQGPLRPRLTRREEAMIDRYVRRVAAGKLSRAAAAREYVATAARLRKRHPELGRVLFERTLTSVTSVLASRSVKLNGGRGRADEIRTVEGPT